MSSIGRVTRFGLRNFKAFHYLEDIELKPLTVLVGANSSGKSSIFQALLLLKQSSGWGRSEETLRFNGDLTRLGGFGNVVSDFDTSKAIELRFGLELFVPLQIRNSPMFQVDPDPDPFRSSDVSMSFGVSEASPEAMLQQVAVATRASHAVPGDLDFSLRYNRTPRNLSLRNLEQFPGLRPAPTDASFRNFWPSSLTRRIVGIVSQADLPEIKISLPPVIELPLVLLRSRIEHLEYLGPIRADPRPFYPIEEEQYLGTRGEGTIPYLLRKQHEPVRYAAPLAADIRDAPLLEAVNHWLRHMNVTAQLTIDAAESIFTATVQSRSATNKAVNLSQVGFGISQLLPVLVMGLKKTDDSDPWLLFEQPESQLHPRLQGELADFFLATARTGKTVMVETHSDHLVGRLRRRIAEDETGELAKMVQILFVHAGTPDNPSSYVEPLTVDENGTIVNCPADFFSESADEAFAILKSRQKRAQKGG